MPCVSCVHRTIVEGSGLGSVGCIVHVDVHGEVVLWVAATQLLLSMTDMVCLVYRSCGVHKQCRVCMACWSVSYKFYCC